MGWTIRPLKTGEIAGDRSNMTLGRNQGKKEVVPSIVWLIEGGPQLILVDTGMCETERANHHHPGSKQEPGEASHELLAKLGIKPEDIGMILFTHLHWDHCQNMELYTKATYVVHEKELAFACNPIPPYYRSYEASVLGITAPFVGKRFEQVSGETKVAEGITVFPTPGHSPGHMSVEVQTAKGKYIIAGDAVMVYENLEEDPAQHLRFRMIGRYINMAEAWTSLERIAGRGGVILPDHDWKIFDQPVYG